MGNVYMIVGGAPEVNKTHANDVARGLLLYTIDVTYYIILS